MDADQANAGALHVVYLAVVYPQPYLKGSGYHRNPVTVSLLKTFQFNQFLLQSFNTTVPSKYQKSWLATSLIALVALDGVSGAAVGLQPRKLKTSQPYISDEVKCAAQVNLGDQDQDLGAWAFTGAEQILSGFLKDHGVEWWSRDFLAETIAKALKAARRLLAPTCN